jgi:hypothetical protein
MDLEGIFQYVQRDVIAVIGVDVITVGDGRMGGFENDLQVTVSRALEFALSGPPVKRLRGGSNSGCFSF